MGLGARAVALVVLSACGPGGPATTPQPAAAPSSSSLASRPAAASGEPSPCAGAPPAVASSATAATRPKQLVQGRHSAAIKHLDFSPAGLLASTSDDGTIRVWDVEQRQQLEVIRNEALREPHSATWYGPERLVTAYTHGTEQIALGGEVVASPTFRGAAGVAAASSWSGWPVVPVPGDGPARWLAGQPNGVQWVDAQGTRAAFLSIPDAASVRWAFPRFAVSADGGVAVAAGGNSLVAWSLRDPTAAGRVVQLDADAGAVALSPRGDRAIVGLRDKPKKALATPTSRFLVVGTAAGSTERRALTGTEAYAHDVAVSADGALVAAATNTELVVWQMASGKLAYRHPSPSYQRELRVVAFSDDGRWLVAGTSDGALFAFDAASGRPHGELGATVRFPLAVELPSADTLIALSPGNATVWSLRDATVSERRAVPGLVGMGVTALGDVVAARIADQAACGWDKTGLLFDGRLELRGVAPPRAATGRPSPAAAPAWPPAGRASKPTCLGATSPWRGLRGFHGSGKLLVSAPDPGPRPDETLAVDDLQTLKRIVLDRAAARDLAGEVFSPSGEHVVALTNTGIGDTSRAVVWSAATGQRIAEVGAGLGGGRQCAQLARMSRDGKHVAVACVGAVAVHEIATGRPVYALAPQKSELRGIDRRVTALAFGADASTLLAGLDDGAVLVAKAGAVVARGASGGGQILALFVDRTGKTAVSIGFDGAARVWDAATAVLRASLVDFFDGEHVAFTPGGAYTGTSEVSERVGWVYQRPFEHFGFERFSRFKSPEVVRKRLAGEPVDAPDEAQRPPRVTILDAPSGKVAKATASIRVRVASTSRVDLVRVYAEGRPVGAGAVCAPEGELELPVPLLPGTNRLSFVAFDGAGLSSNPRTLDVASASTEGRPSLRVVSVGVSRYPKLGADFQLELADDDARALARAFEAQAGAGKPYERASARVLVDDQATVPAILAALDELSGMRPADIAVVSFAGHGVKLSADGDMVFLTSGVEHPAGRTAGLDPESVRKAGVGWSLIADRLAAARGRVVLLLDACHSGHLTQEVIVPNDALASVLARGQRAGVVVFAASKGRQVSYEGGGSTSRGLVLDEAGRADVATAEDHGFFTGAVLKTLESPEADRNGDGAIQLSELVDEVTMRVTRASGGRQTPWVARREIFGDFTLAARRK